MTEKNNPTKRKKPDFLVKESKFSARVKARWRYPRGKHSKVRQRHCGRQALPNPGYGAAKETRGMHPTGLEVVNVSTLKQLEGIDKAKQGVLLSSTLGKRKRLLLLQEAQKNGLNVLNVKDLAEKIKIITDSFAQRKKAKSEKLKEKDKKKEEKKKKAEEKKAEEKKAEEKTEEAPTSESKEKEDSEKKEMEKTIIKRQ